MSLVVDFIDSNHSSAGFLYALDNFPAWAYYGSDHVFRDNHRFDTRRMRFQVGARFGDSVGDNIKNVQTTFAGLVQCFFQNFVRKSVALDPVREALQTALRLSVLSWHRPLYRRRILKEKN